MHEHVKTTSNFAALIKSIKSSIYTGINLEFTQAGAEITIPGETMPSF
jgi:hypothetical protein